MGEGKVAGNPHRDSFLWWMDVYSWTLLTDSREKSLAFHIAFVLDQSMTECPLLLCKDNSALILTFVVKFGLDEGENENISREAKESFHQEVLIYGVFCSYLFCLIYQ